MSATTAVVLARGLGTRMSRDDGSVLDADQAAAADAGAKAMMPVGRPFIEYVVSSLADAGIADVVLVVAPGDSPIRGHFTRTAPPTRVRLHWAAQAEPRGTADAVLAARDAVRAIARARPTVAAGRGEAAFLVVNADNLYPPDALRLAVEIGGNGLVAFDADALVRESGIEPARVLRYALLDVVPGNTLRAIREKPGADDPLVLAPERWVSMNLWSFTPVIFDACDLVTPSARGELELQDAVTIAMRDLGVVFHVRRGSGAVLDLSHRADIATVRARLSGLTPSP